MDTQRNIDGHVTIKVNLVHVFPLVLFIFLLIAHI